MGCLLGLPKWLPGRRTFKFLLSWRWELKAVDREHVAEWFDKDPNAMLVFVTMLTPPRAGRRRRLRRPARRSRAPRAPKAPSARRSRALWR